MTGREGAFFRVAPVENCRPSGLAEDPRAGAAFFRIAPAGNAPFQALSFWNASKAGSFSATCLRKIAGLLVWAGAARAGGLFSRRACGKRCPSGLGGVTGREGAFFRVAPAENCRPSGLGGRRASGGLFSQRACGKPPPLWFERAPRERGGLFSRRACGKRCPSGLGAGWRPSPATCLRKTAVLPIWVGFPGRGLLSRCACGKRNPSGLGGVTGREGAFFRVAPVENCRPSGLAEDPRAGAAFFRIAPAGNAPFQALSFWNASKAGSFSATCLRKIAGLLVWAGAARAGGLFSRRACGKRCPSGLGGVTGREGAFFRVAPAENCRPSGLGGRRASGGLFSQRACGKPPPLWFERAPRERGGLFSRRACGKRCPSGLGAGWRPSPATCLRKTAVLPIWVGFPGRGLLSHRACGKPPPFRFGRVPRERGPFSALRLRKTAGLPAWVGGDRAGGDFPGRRFVSYCMGAVLGCMGGSFRQAMAKA